MPNVGSMSVQITGLSDQQVLDIKTLVDTYQTGGGTQLTGTAGSPTVPLSGFAESTYVLQMNRQNLNQQWTTLESILIGEVFAVVADPNP